MKAFPIPLWVIFLISGLFGLSPAHADDGVDEQGNPIERDEDGDASGGAHSDDDSGRRSGMKIIVTGSRSALDPFDVARGLSVLDVHDLKLLAPRTTPQALHYSTGVWVQRTNHAGGSTFVRGLTGRQVLLMQDGVRLNNSVFRAGPSQYLNTISPFDIQRIEIVRGPGSVLYGSDALAGTINVITTELQPYRSMRWEGVEFLGQTNSSDREKTGGAYTQFSLINTTLRLGGNYRDFDNVRGGYLTGVQPFTAYQEGALMAKARHDINDRHYFLLSVSMFRQTNAARTDRYRAPKPAARTGEKGTDGRLNKYEEQWNDIVWARYHGDVSRLLNYQLFASLVHMREQRSETAIPWDNPVADPTRRKLQLETDNVWTLGTGLQFNSRKSWWLDAAYGAEFYNDWVSSQREDASFNGEAMSLDTANAYPRGRFIDGAGYRQLGVYLQDTLRPFDWWGITPGVRFNWISSNVASDPDFGDPSFSEANVVASLSTIFHVIDGLNLFAGVHQGFRAPNLDDMLGQGDFGGGFDLPNPALTSEKSLTFEGGPKWRSGWLHAGVTGHVTKYDGLMVRSPAKYHDRDKNDLGLQYYRRENSTNALIWGVESEATLIPQKNWEVFGNATYTYGVNRDRKLENDTGPVKKGESEPISRIPPLNGIFGVRYRFLDPNLVLELAGRWSTRQDRLAISDTTDTRIPTGGTPGFLVFDSRLGYQHEVFDVSLGVENITNETYRYHGSGVDAPGTNVFMMLRLRTPEVGEDG
ncbi:MAG: Vitamin B12 transporter BtuB [Myxococcota bacterium]|nr:Vitamin B12 transporter BtuB [Myxococcota bacterium]